MPKKNDPTQPANEEPALIVAAKAIGKAAGKVAAMAGSQPDAPPARAAANRAKFPKKDKHRLPRRQKKAQQKTLAAKN